MTLASRSLGDSGHVQDHNDIAAQVNANTSAIAVVVAGQSTQNVLTYGAVGNGVVDDTNAIHAARAAAGVGGSILFPPGTYLHTGIVANLAGQTWTLMQGATLSLKTGANANSITISANSVSIMGPGVIDGNRTGQATSSRGVYASLVSKPTVSGVTIQNTFDEGAWFDACTSPKFLGNVVTGCGTASANFKQVIFLCTSGSSADIDCCDNTVDSSGRHNSAIGLSSAVNGNVLAGARVHRNRAIVGDAGATDTLGIELFSSNGGGLSDFTVLGNVVVAENNTNTNCFGISVGGSATGASNGNQGGTVTGNTVRDCGKVALEAIGSGIVISANSIQGCGWCSLSAADVVGGANSISFTGNALRAMKSTSYALAVQGGTAGLTNVLVSGNAFTNNAGPNVDVSGVVTGLVVADNALSWTAAGGAGVTLAGTLTDISVTGNRISGGSAGTDGVYVGTNATLLHIHGNRISSVGRNGVYNNATPTDLIVTNNVIRSCGANGIYMNAGTRVHIRGNHLLNNTQWGVNYVGGSPLFADGNYASGNGAGQLGYSGATFAAPTIGGTTGTTAPAAGAGGALPATPAGYLTVNVNNTDRQVAYY